MCRKYGATGPVIRGAGVAYDVRRAEPYSVYPKLDFKIPTYPEATRWPATWCAWTRWSRACASSSRPSTRSRRAVHRQGAARLKLPPGDTCYAVEAARGRFMVRIVSDGKETPYRVKLRTPSFSNLSLFEEASKGMILPDALAMMGSLDLVIPDIDR
jgi:NADH-quinone oxidoreductase subunit D